ncbi:MAG: CorA family divalent cation transporter [Ignavibacteria bacterium]
MKLNKNEKLYSYHIFLFPFKWRKRITEEVTLKDKYDVKLFCEELTRNNKWNRKQFHLDYFDNYNEYNYFYDYAREALYDLDTDFQSREHNYNLINHFEYNIEKETTYNIKLLGEENTYNLEIDSILLNIYRTGTAILSFHLRNKKYHGKKDILKINKFGRRLYLPFFDSEPETIYTGEKADTCKKNSISTAKKFEIPDALWIGNADLSRDNKNLFEDFEKFKEKKNFQYGSFLLPKFIEGLFPDNFFLLNESAGYRDFDAKDKNKRYKFLISPVLDDRMHVVCWYGNTELVNELNKISSGNDFDLGRKYITDNRANKNQYTYVQNDWWYNYVYIDYPDPMLKDKFIKQKLVKENTYSRWVEWGTLYGISRYSMVMLTSNFSDLEMYNAAFLVKHLQGIYYKMAELCLLQRATVLSFSDEVTHVANLIDRDEEIKKKAKRNNIEKIEELYKYYILFINKIYFREITAQEQGIEIYDMMQKTMRIPDEVKALDDEIDELSRFSSIVTEKELAREANNLARIATIFLIPTLIASLLGMNVLPNFNNIPNYLFSLSPVWPFWISIVLIILITWIGYKLFMKFLFGKKKHRTK